MNEKRKNETYLTRDAKKAKTITPQREFHYGVGAYVGGYSLGLDGYGPRGFTNLSRLWNGHIRHIDMHGNEIYLTDLTGDGPSSHK